MRSRPLLIAGRVALWAAVILVFGRGFVSLFAGPAARGVAPHSQAGVVVGEGYPTAAAEAFAARFAADYLTFDESNAADWAHRTAVYGTDSLAGGWDGKGRQSVTSVILAAIDVINPTYGVVTVAAQTTSGWMHLAVPLAAAPGGLAVAARPAFVATAPSGKAPDLEAGATDSHAADELRPTVEAFLGAYATGQTAVIHALSADGAHLPELEGGRLTLAGVDTITVPTTTPAGETDRAAVVTMRWADVRSGAGLTQTYRIGLVRSGERWLVTSLGPVRPEPNPNPVKEKS
jgi:hypothetical protein